VFCAAQYTSFLLYPSVLIFILLIPFLATPPLPPLSSTSFTLSPSSFSPSLLLTNSSINPLDDDEVELD
jgi:hypothetical protein